MAGSGSIDASGGLSGHSGLYTGTSPNNSVRSPCAQNSDMQEKRGRQTPTFGKESCIFHVTILTFRNFRGSDSLLWGDAAASLRAVDAGLFCVEGNKDWNRRANTLAGHSGSEQGQSLMIVAGTDRCSQAAGEFWWPPMAGRRYRCR